MSAGGHGTDGGGAEFDKAGGADTGLGSVWAMERERC